MIKKLLTVSAIALSCNSMAGEVLDRINATGNVNIGYASKLMGRLLPLLDDLDKCNTNERGDGFYAGVDDDARDRLQSAMMKAWDEHVMNNKWRCE